MLSRPYNISVYSRSFSVHKNADRGQSNQLEKRHLLAIEEMGSLAPAYELVWLERENLEWLRIDFQGVNRE